MSDGWFFVKNGILVLILTFSCQYVAKFLLYLDLNKRVYNHAPGSCSHVASIEHGAEDMELVDDHCVLVSTGLKQNNNSDLLNVTGKIFLYNATSQMAWELKLESKNLNSKNFFPHGIGLWKDRYKTSLAVVNHRPKAETIEIFSFDSRKRQLNHSRTIKSPLFRNLDDVACVSRETFYAINRNFFKQEFLRNLELYFSLPFGNVIFFDGKKTRVVVDWIATPSGITLDISKKWLYVSSLTREEIIIFRIEPDHSLTKHSTIDLYTSPDNIGIDPYTADIFVATHPVKIRKFRYDAYPSALYSPSLVLKIKGRPSKGNWTITQIYANDGAALTSASVCLRVRDKLVIGSTHDKLLACDIDNPTLL